MTINKLYQVLTPYVFFALICGFIIYHIAAAYGAIPFFLGGYFGIASAVTAAIYLLILPITLKNNLITRFYLSILHCTAFIYVLAVTATSSIYSDIPGAAVTQSYNMLVMWVALFSLGFYLLQSNIEKTIKLSYVFYALFIAFIIYYISDTGTVMLKLQSLSDDGADDVSGYQSLARNFLIIALLLICYSNSAKRSLLLILSAVFCMFYLGARSEFVALIAFVCVFILLKTRSNIRYFMVALVGAAAMAALAIYFQDDIAASRQLQVLNYSDSASWNARAALEDLGKKDILNHPFIGNFGGHAVGDDVGGYIHNSLSAWANYGLYFYLAYMFISIFTSISSFVKTLKTNEHAWWFAFAINSTCLFLIIFAKPVFWPLPFFAWGVYMSASYMQKKALI